jgi:hypothetical protein
MNRNQSRACLQIASGSKGEILGFHRPYSGHGLKPPVGLNAQLSAKCAVGTQQPTADSRQLSQKANNMKHRSSTPYLPDQVAYSSCSARKKKKKLPCHISSHSKDHSLDIDRFGMAASARTLTTVWGL